MVPLFNSKSDKAINQTSDRVLQVT